MCFCMFHTLLSKGVLRAVTPGRRSENERLHEITNETTEDSGTTKQPNEGVGTLKSSVVITCLLYLPQGSRESNHRLAGSPPQTLSNAVGQSHLEPRRLETDPCWLSDFCWASQIPTGTGKGHNQPDFHGKDLACQRLCNQAQPLWPLVPQ